MFKKLWKFSENCIGHTCFYGILGFLIRVLVGPVAQSVKRLATGWTVRGSNPGGGARFSAPVQTGPGDNPASCTIGTGSFREGKERPGRDVDPSPPSSAVGHERVELYLYSPYGPYGLYRASVPVQGWPLLTLLRVLRLCLDVSNTSTLTRWGRGHLNCLNARSRGF